MNKGNLSGILMVVGGVCLLFSFLGRSSVAGIVFGLILLGVGYALRNSSTSSLRQNTSQPVANELAPGFTATHRHDNIAIDSVSKNLWLRDESGMTCVLTPDQVRGWNVDWTSQTMMGGLEKYKDCKLLIKTSSLDRPVYRIRFNSYTAMSYQTKKNVQEAEEWSDRLSALYGQR